MTFEVWAQQVDVIIRSRIPWVRVERDMDEMYRWACGAGDVQAHACGDESVVLISLDGHAGAQVRKLRMRESPPADVAHDVVNRFSTVPATSRSDRR
ncbi:MAG TPA: hypothetical protein VFE17_09685 [Candidatus Baltobacteraceae bacterium]|jgi:hypothetical protein|nr:hypothetical protein [Candidatus Baltobacteraceae bacterium]